MRLVTCLLEYGTIARYAWARGDRDGAGAIARGFSIPLRDTGRSVTSWSDPLSRVLVVDPTAGVATSLAVKLTSFGYAVRTASDGLTALEVAVEFRPRVALIAIGVTIIDGWELAERLNTQALFKRPRLIALTAVDRPEYRARSIGAGFECQLLKPVLNLARLHDLLAERVACSG